MKVMWLSGRRAGLWTSPHLLLEGKISGPFCDNWAGSKWYDLTEGPYSSKCEWCLKAEQWIRLVGGEPLDVLKRIPGYHHG
jgi:hypothetical protein